MQHARLNQATRAVMDEPCTLQLDRLDIQRLLQALLADELQTLKRRSLPPDLPATWGAEARLDEEGLGFDSLALLQACSRVNQFFHLHEVGIEDYLFIRRTLGDWIEIVETALRIKSVRITFQTSGSTGSPKACTHAISALSEEIVAQAAHLGDVRRVVAFVPCHHIYGFLFTVALPKRLQVECVDARAWSPGKLKLELRPGDLLVSTPFHWRILLTSLAAFPNGLIGVSSTAPMPADLRTDLTNAGLSRLVEIYGSSETAGVGYRASADAGFQLFPFWRWDQATQHLVRTIDGERQQFKPQDSLAFQDAIHFRPQGRTDGAVQIGGTNVFPEHVAAIIRRHPLVVDCAIRLDGEGASQRLKAFIALGSDGDERGCNPDEIESYIQRELKVAERPIRIAYGQQLPRSPIGKLIDW